ncbi:MAG: hypothetical protein NZL95_04210 [Chitinophagales bacterium]|nr:hypothetical protein [Chitinophagales bacterium]MDW8427734.1 hypothetical protein [Chitinophagales bacterium]
MRFKEWLVIAHLVALFATTGRGELQAQAIPGRERNISTKADTVQLDTLSIVPGSVTATYADGTPLASEYYELDYWKALWIWKKKPETDSVRLRYRVFPLLFTQPVRHKDFDVLNKYDSIMGSRIIYAPSELLFASSTSERLTYSGSYARGISFGNNQDLVVNSSFNLQMQGKIAGDVDVTAAMSDNNVPLQPEGNTQQLQEFDKIFIQFRKDRTSLIIGDYELSKPAGYFMNFYKKLQGLSFQTSYDRWDMRHHTFGSVAAARGKYVRKEFMGQEGNQGPYRLGGMHETYVVILAGTERVYVDGELLQRGADRDYVIDYNLGEIVFTPRRLITKDKRIVVEYQYAERAYLRTVLWAGQQLSYQQLSARIAVYSEQDARNQPLQQVLTDAQKAVLESIGNRLELAFYAGYDSIGYRTDRPMYRRTDSLGYDVFVYSTDPQRAHYDVRFSYVGPGRGNYRIAPTATNGRVYYWIAPVNNQPQGDYEPIVPLIAPQRQQLITVGLEVKASERTALSIETALSNNDPNTFSSINNRNNIGPAAFFRIQHQLPSKGKVQSSLHSSYEVVSAAFRPIERYRPVEFGRDWNLGNAADTVSQHLADLSVQVQLPQRFQAGYQVAAYLRTDRYRGLRQTVSGSWTKGGWESRAHLSYLIATDDSVRSDFLRPTIELSQRIFPHSSIRVGIRNMQELNRFRQTGSDSLQASSFYWNEATFFIRNSDTARVQWHGAATRRDDFAVAAGSFRRSTVGNNLEAGLRWQQGQQQAEVMVTYRKLSVLDTLLTVNRPDASTLLRLRHEGSFHEGFFTTNTLYEANVGQVQKQEFAYAPVATGAGTHVWIDYNGDGIQQINEFELAPFASDGAFVKVLLPTNEYTRCYHAQLNQSLHLSPRHLYRGPGAQRHVLSRFSLLVTAQISQRSFGNTWWQRFSPVGLNVADSLLLAASVLNSATVYFNRTNPHFGADVFRQSVATKNLLTNGLELRRNTTWGSRLRWNITRKVALLSTVQRTNQLRTLQYLPTGGFDIKGYELNSQFSFLPRTTLRITAGYRYHYQRNLGSELSEQAFIHQGESEVRLNMLAKSSVSAKATLAKVRFDGSASSPAGYAMLQGLQQGLNFISQLSAERQLTQMLELTIVYEGRKTGSAHWVHTGRMQVRALF